MGIFRYQRLMFPINCTPELSQKLIQQIVSHCSGYIHFLDDITVFGKDQAEHDLRLHEVSTLDDKEGLILK